MTFPFQLPTVDKDSLLNLYGGEFSPGYQGYVEDVVGRSRGVADLYQKQQEADLNAKLRDDKIKKDRAPLELEALTLGNNAQRVKNKYDSSVNDAKIEQFFRENQGKISADNLRELQDTGTIFSQIGAQVVGITDPILRNLKTKELFDKYGFKDRYDDMIDGKDLVEIGKAMLVANSKAQQALQAQDSKNTAADDRLKATLASREKIAALQAQVKRVVAGIQKQPVEKRPGSYQALAAKLTEQAIQASRNGDQEQASMYQTLAQQALATAQGLIQAAAQSRQTGSIDQGAVTNLPTVPQPAPVQGVTVTPTKPQAPQKATSTERVRVQSPDGRVGTIPASQLKEALANGWKEAK